jgi:hypothetical protein
MINVIVWCAVCVSSIGRVDLVTIAMGLRARLYTISLIHSFVHNVDQTDVPLLFVITDSQLFFNLTLTNISSTAVNERIRFIEHEGMSMADKHKVGAVLLLLLLCFAGAYRVAVTLTS